MELLKTLMLHGHEVKIFHYWGNTMRVVVRSPEGSVVSFTCPYDEALEETEQVQDFLKTYFAKWGAIADY